MFWFPAAAWRLFYLAVSPPLSFPHSNSLSNSSFYFSLNLPNFQYFCLPRSLFHSCTFGISQSPFSCPYLVLNWAGSSGFWFWWRIDRNRERQREGKREQHKKTYRNKKQKKGTCRSSEVNNKIRPWSTWRRTNRHGELSWKPSPRKDERVRKSEFFLPCLPNLYCLGRETAKQTST